MATDPPHGGHVLLFGAFDLDLATGELCKNGRKIRLYIAISPNGQHVAFVAGEGIRDLANEQASEIPRPENRPRQDSSRTELVRRIS